MFWIDNLIGDFIGSLYGAKPQKWYSGWSVGGRSVGGRGKKMYNIWYKPQAQKPIVSYIPSDPKNDPIQQAREAMKYGGIDKFKL